MRVMKTYLDSKSIKQLLSECNPHSPTPSIQGSPPCTPLPVPEPQPPPSNHVRIQVSHIYEHGCYNSFTLYRGCPAFPTSQ